MRRIHKAEKSPSTMHYIMEYNCKTLNLGRWSAGDRVSHLININLCATVTDIRYTFLIFK